LAKIGSRIDIGYAVVLIEEGRRKHFIEESALEGLQQFKEGSELLRQAFIDAKATGDVELILRAEHSFLSSQIAAGNPDETRAHASAEKGLEVIEDALRALKTVSGSTVYKGVELAFPRHGKAYRYKGLPKDAFHVCCESHIARLNNGLTRYGVSDIDRELIKLRVGTLAAIEEIYCNMQRKVLAENINQNGENGNDSGD
jgi:hypothetical protein